MLTITYGMCFGVELTMNSVARLLTYYELLTASAYCLLLTTYLLATYY